MRQVLITSTLLLPLCLIVIFQGGCSKKSAQEAAGSMQVCDTNHVTYTKDILPVVQSYCYPCHGNGNTAFSGGVNLEGYESLKGWAQSGYIVGPVTHASGYIGMPYGKPMLNPCAVNLFVAWVNQGEQE